MHQTVAVHLTSMHDRRVDLGCPCCLQVLGRNLEALVTRAQEVKADWKDEYVSVEHMLLAFVDDTKFGREVIFNKSSDLDRAKLEAAVKDIRGTNRVTDQVSRAAVACCCLCKFAAHIQIRCFSTHTCVAWQLCCSVCPTLFHLLTLLAGWMLLCGCCCYRML